MFGDAAAKELHDQVFQVAHVDAACHIDEQEVLSGKNVEFTVF